MRDRKSNLLANAISASSVCSAIILIAPALSIEAGKPNRQMRNAPMMPNSNPKLLTMIFI